VIPPPETSQSDFDPDSGVVSPPGEDDAAPLGDAAPPDTPVVETGEADVERYRFRVSKKLTRRIDQYLVDRVPYLSRANVQRLIDEGLVKVNGKPIPIFQLNGDTPMSDRVPTVKRWANVDGPAVIVCMLQVAGVGLNMTASRHVSFLDKLFVPGLNKQAIDRAYRIGADETQPVQVREYICRNTIESRVEQILRGKSKLIHGLVESDPTWKKKLLTAIMEEESAAA